MSETNEVKALKKPRARKAKKPQLPLQFPESYWVYAADLSLRRPGFCRMHISRDGGNAVITELTAASIDNKKDKVKTRGQLLDEIFFGIGTYAPHNDADPSALDPVFYVREKAINSRGAMAEIGIFEVVGIADFWAWQKKNSEWFEIYPVTVKKIITGDSKATKTKVADYLKLYVGDYPFANDDESDAASVAISWLIQCGQIQNKLEKENS